MVLNLLKLGFSYAAAFIVWLCYTGYFSTLKISKNNSRSFPQDLAPGCNVIYAFWHSKTFVLLPFFRGLGVGVLTLRDWKNIIYEQLCAFYGYQTVSVTSATGATVRLKKLLQGGHLIGLAVDGPRGPAGVIKPGVLYLAKNTSKPIVAVGVQVKESFRMGNRWDRFEVPLPFSEAVISMSEPLQVDGNNVKEIEEKLSMFLKEF